MDRSSTIHIPSHSTSSHTHLMTSPSDPPASSGSIPPQNQNHVVPPAAVAASLITHPSSTVTSTTMSTTWNNFNSSLPAPLSRLTFSYFLSGALARVTSSIIISPLDCIKVRTQFSQAAVGVQQYTGAFDAARHMWRSEGPIAFYRGLPMRILYVAPSAAVSFVCYEQFRALYHKNDDAQTGQHQRTSLSTLWPLLLGGGARIIGSTIRTPFDLIRQRMQIQGSLADRTENLAKPIAQRRHGVYSNSAEALWRVTKMEGIATLWTGLGVTILRDIPFAMIYFYAYESSKTFQEQYFPSTVPSKTDSSTTPPASAQTTPPHPRHRPDMFDASSVVAATPGLSPAVATQLVKLESRASGLSTPRYALSGAFAACCGVMVTMPMDVMKVRLQTQGSLAQQQPRYSNLRDCAKKIWHEEGLRGFYKGTVPRLMYLVPASALTFSLYEIYKTKMQKWMALEEVVEDRIRLRAE